MSTHKTKIDQSLVSSFLERHFNEPTKELTYIEGGEGSQAFSFNAGAQELIFRANTRNGSFEKDRYAYEHFGSAAIPIPKIIETGKLDEKYYYAISERARGVKIDALSEEKRATVLPKLFKVLDNIHDADVNATQGYGKWDSEGRAEHKSWQSFLKSLKKWVSAPKGSPDLFETSMLEKDVWQRVYKEILSLIRYCPEDRYLLHGDYGFDNVFSDGTDITGVIDWGEAGYGDFLYDGAWLSYWSKNHQYRQVVADHYAARPPIPHFEERMRCYELHIGLGALTFYAFSEQEKKYEWDKTHLLALL